MGIKPLPADLNEAIQVMEQSDLVAEALGEHVFDFFLRNKREEWADYRRQVSRFELDRYLPDALAGRQSGQLHQAAYRQVGTQHKRDGGHQLTGVAEQPVLRAVELRFRARGPQQQERERDDDPARSRW